MEQYLHGCGYNNRSMQEVRQGKFRVILQMQQQANAGCYSFPLYLPENELHGRRVPHIFFAAQHAAIRTPEDFGMTGHALVQQTFDHLRQQHTSWQEVAGEAGQLQYIYCAQPAAAARLLDPFCMETACSLLQAQELAVMIPHADLLLVSPLQTLLGNDVFTARAKQEFEKIAAETLSDLAFIYAQSRIIGVQELLSATKDKPDEQGQITAGPGQLLKIVEIPVFTGDFFYKIEIGAGDDMQLLDLCEQAIFGLLQRALAQPRFLGIMEFVICRDITPFTPALDDKLSRFWRSLQGSARLRQCSARLKRNLELSILFGEDFAAGQVHRRKHFKLIYNK